MATYYINIKPHLPYSTIIVAYGGFIPKEFTAENDWISYDRNRQFVFDKGHLVELVRFLFSQDRDDCTIRYRDNRGDEWNQFKRRGFVKKCKEIETRCEQELDERWKRININNI